MIERLCFRMGGRRIGLHREILGRAGNRVLIRTVVDHRMYAGEVIERRRRRNAPFERSSIPWVVARLGALLYAPEQVDQENDLHGRGEIGGMRTAVATNVLSYSPQIHRQIEQMLI